MLIKAGSALMVPRSTTTRQDVSAHLADNGQLRPSPRDRDPPHYGARQKQARHRAQPGAALPRQRRQRRPVERCEGQCAFQGGPAGGDVSCRCAWSGPRPAQGAAPVARPASRPPPLPPRARAAHPPGSGAESACATAGQRGAAVVMLRPVPMRTSAGNAARQPCPAIAAPEDASAAHTPNFCRALRARSSVRCATG